MSNDKPPSAPHPSGELVQHQLPVAPAPQAGPPEPVSIDSWAGQIRVEWDPGAPLTPLGQASFFIEFLKVAGLFDALVADCPLARTSPNAPTNRAVVGTIVLSVLAGHKRYAHVTTLRADGVLPELLGIGRILSEDAVRRALAVIDEANGTVWLHRHLDHCTAPLFGEGWSYIYCHLLMALVADSLMSEISVSPRSSATPIRACGARSRSSTRS